MSGEITGSEVITEPTKDQTAVIDGHDKLAPSVLKGGREHKASANISDERAAKFGQGESTREAVDASYVGWKQIGGWQESDQLTDADELADLSKDTYLNNIIPDKFYGDWYHCLGLILIGGIFSFLIGFFKFSFAPVFPIALITSLLYRTSSIAYRATLRNQVQKELTVQKIEDDYESLEWLNTFLDKYWPRLEPTVSQMVTGEVNQVLQTNPAIPAFIKAIWIDQFTLGVKAPRIEAVKTFQNTNSDVVVMDWVLSFTPHDLSDVNAKQLRNYVNQKVVVKAKLFGLTIPVYLSNISFKVETRVRFKLMTPFPHVETVNFQLLKIPDIDFVAKVLGDFLFNWEVMSIPGLLPAVKKLAQVYAGNMVLPPFSLQFNVPQLLSGSAVSMGVLEITIKNVRGLNRSTGLLVKSIDPYLTFELGGKIVGHTRTVRDTLNPVWDETIYILLNAFTDPLTISIYDKREKLKDKLMGIIEYNLTILQKKAYHKNLKANFLRNSKPVGLLNFDMRFFPTLEAKKLPDGTVEAQPEFNTGITKITIEEARGLADVDEKVSAYVELYVNAKLVLTTSKAASKNVLSWNQGYEAVIMDRSKTRCRIVIKDDKGETISAATHSLNDLVDRTQSDKKAIPLQSSKGLISVSTIWKPVDLDVGNNAVAYTPPIGVLRILLNKAENLRNLEKVGKIDPYARVLVNGSVKGRTTPRSQTLHPVWNQAVYVAVTSTNQKVSIEVMDVETVKEDRTLGTFDLELDDLFQKGADDRYIETIDDDPRSGRLVSKKGAKGTVTYYVSFYPALPILSLEEIEELGQVHDKRSKFEERLKEQKGKKLSKKEQEEQDEEEMLIKDIESLYNNKMKLDFNELLQYKSGVFAASILSGEVSQTGLYVQAFFDGAGEPRITSNKIATRSIHTGWTGDVMIKELEYSVTTFRVTKDKDANKAEDCICEVVIPTIELIKNCYFKPSILTLTGVGSAKLMLQASWFPIGVSKLPQADLITNSGDLKIIAKSAERLISADTNGFSDPFLKFYLNDQKEAVFKTKHQKKTLDPTWNESKTIEIHNRVNDYLRIKVMDWDAANKNDQIGYAILPLSKVDPENQTDLEIAVVGEEGEDGGVLHLSFEFSPRYTLNVLKSEKKVGDIAQQGLGTGLKVGTTVVGAGFGTIGKLGRTMFGGKKNHYVAQGVYNNAI
ncbi:hypothetical protein HG535_0G00980 [Zygotorulaspora mrakii]|uniref:Tricalbin n=1 Tax=Zygotorulaspora mrakii TaxID=42260 RepID=A0A7H9B7I7_ZYGMR|nr:uncharacterized protein HG535_0G00980 [Zygotorulaspora mrakii]QLG74214.1 hypothetical protein HG535_0G00980 [Zygotorulaspora mrakii]